MNAYYADFANAHLFDPSLSLEELKSKPVPDMQRLSTLYNADVGLYMLANKVFILIRCILLIGIRETPDRILCDFTFPSNS